MARALLGPRRALVIGLPAAARVRLPFVCVLALAIPDVIKQLEALDRELLTGTTSSGCSASRSSAPCS